LTCIRVTLFGIDRERFCKDTLDGIAQIDPVRAERGPSRGVGSGDEQLRGVHPFERAVPE